MNFRTVADLARSVSTNLCLIPRTVDLIVGVPRSGLIPASLLSLHLNVPMTDVEGLAAGRLLGCGERRQWGAGDADYLSTPRHALVIDDSILSGNQMTRVRERLAAAGLPHRLTYAAVYATPEAVQRGLVDIHFEIVPLPRVWEWNVMHHVVLSTACVDIDGLLCADPTEEENDDGPAYERFLATARPLFPCSRPIATLVSARLEKYRPHTERWLAAHGIRYGELVLLDLPDGATRKRLGVHASFKADVYKARPHTLFIESNPRQAADIARLAGKPVLCLPTREMFHPPAPLPPAPPPGWQG